MGSLAATFHALHRRPVCEQGQRLLHREEQPLHVAVEGLVEARLGDLPQRDKLAAARVGEEDVDAALLLLDDRVKPIEVCQDRDIAWDHGDPRPERLHRRVELGLAASRDEDVRAPSRANRCAVASPIPLLPPVTTATFPSSLPMAWLLSVASPTQ